MPNAQPHDTIAPAFVTVADACTYLSLSLPTLYRILGRKKLATAKAGRRTLIRMASLQAYADLLPAAKIKAPTRAKRKGA